MGFASDVDKWCKKVPLEVNNAVCNKYEPLLNEVVVLSPNPPGKGGYSKGITKGGWYPSVDSINYSVNSVKDETGATSFSRIKAILASKPFLNKDATLYFSNSTPWINYVENIGWPKNYPGNDTGWDWSGKIGPYAMVQTAITNFKGATH
jgi:hypothetical protein